MQWYEIIILIVSILIVLIFLFAFITYKIVFYNKNEKEDVYTLQVKLDEKDTQKMISLIDEFISIKHEEVTITSFDGLKLKGRYYHIDDSYPIQIQFHGYRGNSYRDMCGGNKLARENKFNTLVIDQRAHGKSQGHTITFGVKESKDCMSWINYVKKIH